jgi:hypothetical protein
MSCNFQEKKSRSDFCQFVNASQNLKVRRREPTGWTIDKETFLYKLAKIVTVITVLKYIFYI